MSFVEADELTRIDRSFAGNSLLATFPKEARAFIEPHTDVVELRTGGTVLRRGDNVQASLFPSSATTVSMVSDLSDGRSVQVASIGSEGAVGGIISCGNAPAFTRATVLVGGPALSVPMAALEDAKNRSAFISNLFCRYSDFLLSQVMQTVACNSFHSVQARAARWLLVAQNRAGDRLEITQETLAGLLGAQRTTVNAAIRALQDAGVIELGRSRITVTDRAGLKRQACECYQILEQHYSMVIGATGRGSD